MKDVVIVGALRTPIGCFRGALAGHSAVELGSLVVKALIERTGVPAYAVYSAAIFLIPICISFDTAEKRRYATYLILNRRFSFEFRMSF
ncbi:TPA: hypothetical protein J1246_002150 [Escherichia coli]|nr:hypothetical protein [Escherichia coli]HBA8922832.1 hypothetical protein [Escherichia coli]